MTIETYSYLQDALKLFFIKTSHARAIELNQSIPLKIDNLRKPKVCASKGCFKRLKAKFSLLPSDLPITKAKHFGILMTVLTRSCLSLGGVRVNVSPGYAFNLSLYFTLLIKKGYKVLSARGYRDNFIVLYDKRGLKDLPITFILFPKTLCLPCLYFVQMFFLRVKPHMTAHTLRHIVRVTG